MADIRSFWGGAGAVTPAKQAASMAVAGKKRTVDLSAADHKLLQQAKRQKEAKQKKAQAKEDNYYCDPELIAMYENNTLRMYLDSHNTAMLQSYCSEHGIPRSQPKYKLMSALLDHVMQGAMKKEAKSKGGVEGDTEQLFSKASMGFKGGCALFFKLVKGSVKIANAEERMDTIVGAVRGMDNQIFKAITGPNCKKYNGR